LKKALEINFVAKFSQLGQISLKWMKKQGVQNLNWNCKKSLYVISKSAIAQVQIALMKWSVVKRLCIALVHIASAQEDHIFLAPNAVLI
jgi:hypothetical protein